MKSETAMQYLERTNQIKRDRDDYYLAMLKGNSETCYVIEKKYNLDGYSPEFVTVGLNALARGLDVDKAIDKYLGVEG